jgi:hypothetical protein
MLIRLLLGALAALAALAATAASAESADHYRGGWRTEGGEPQVYQFVIRGSEVSGYYCTQCADGTTLAPLEGTFDERDGLAFEIRQLDLAGATVSSDTLRAKLAGGKLVLSGTSGDFVAIKDPRGPTPGPYKQSILPPGAPPVPIVPAAAGSGRPPPPYVAPGAWRQLSADDIVGVWLGFGVGMEKQYFFIRRDGEKLFGLACGRCDNPYTHGALENFAFNGDTVEFDINHQDWGDGDVVPFSRHVVARITMNELRMDARRPDQTSPNANGGIVASLVGPIALEATRGNVIGD